MISRWGWFMSHRAFALQVGQAFRIKSEVERSGKLHRLVGAIANIIAGSGVEEHDSYAARYGIVYRGLRERAERRALCEVDLALYAKSGQREQAACCFALIFDMPIELSESAVSAEDPGFLLLACRSRQFAWSTVDALLSLASGRMNDKLFAMQCCDDYHTLATADAQRFMRLLKVNLQSRLLTPSQVGAELRTNVR